MLLQVTLDVQRSIRQEVRCNAVGAARCNSERRVAARVQAS
jgi:hypothetical protein